MTKQGTVGTLVADAAEDLCRRPILPQPARGRCVCGHPDPPKKVLRISGYIPVSTMDNRREWAAVIEAVARLKAPSEVVSLFGLHDLRERD